MPSTLKTKRSKFRVGDRVSVRRWRDQEPLIGVVVRTSGQADVLRRADGGPPLRMIAPGVDIQPDGTSCNIEAHDDQVTIIARRKA